jgi:hypothetical protein
MPAVSTSPSRMDKSGDRYARRNGKWAKITKQKDGKGYTVVRGWEGDFKCVPGGVTINVRFYGWARQWAASWLDDK